jgi:hypothetical protein
MKLDDAIIEELRAGGEGTVNEIGLRLAARVQHAMARLVKSKQVYKFGLAGSGNEKIYSLSSIDPTKPIKRRV